MTSRNGYVPVVGNRLTQQKSLQQNRDKVADGEQNGQMTRSAESCIGKDVDIQIDYGHFDARVCSCPKKLRWYGKL